MREVRVVTPYLWSITSKRIAMALNRKVDSISSTWREVNVSLKQELKETFLSRQLILIRVWHIWERVSTRLLRASRTYLIATQSWHSSSKMRSVETQKRLSSAPQVSKWCISRSPCRHWTLQHALKRSRQKLRRTSCDHRLRWCSWLRSSRPRWKPCGHSLKKMVSSQTSVHTNWRQARMHR